MPKAGRVVAVVGTALVAACALASCGSSPAAVQKSAARHGRTTTSTTTSTTTTTTTSTTAPSTPLTAPAPPTTPQVAVPNVIGLKVPAARAALHAATLASVSLNAPCNMGAASQSVAASLATPGTTADPRVGARPLSPGALVARGSSVGITWSGCYGDASRVPAVVGLSLPAARQALRAVGLAWACYSVGVPTTTTTTTTNPSTSTTAPVTTTTAPRPPKTVLTQNPPAQTVLRPGATVTLTMYRCLQ
jgi:beta-lactam-binding protein with PASTA domain